MTQTKTGAFLSLGRIPQFFGHAAVAAGLLAGGASLLNAGGAMAINCPPLVESTVNATFDPGTGSIQCVNATINQSVVNYQFNPPILQPASNKFEYTLTSTKPGFYWVSADLDSDHGGTPTNVSVVKDIFSDPGYTNLIGTLTSINGQPTAAISLPNTYASIYVRDTYTIPAGDGGVLFSMTNTFEQTPGPLPILGAGAAFGFSRKLRGRIKAGRTA